MVALISIQIADLNRTEKPLTIVFYFALFSAPITAMALPFVATVHDAQGWLAAARHRPRRRARAVAADAAALRFGTVASVIVMDYSGAVLGDAVRLAPVRHAAAHEHLGRGAAWCVIAGLVIAWREHRLVRAARPLVPAEEPDLDPAGFVLDHSLRIKGLKQWFAKSSWRSVSPPSR